MEKITGKVDIDSIYVDYDGKILELEEVDDYGHDKTFYTYFGALTELIGVKISALKSEKQQLKQEMKRAGWYMLHELSPPKRKYEIMLLPDTPYWHVAFIHDHSVLVNEYKIRIIASEEDGESFRNWLNKI